MKRAAEAAAHALPFVSPLANAAIVLKEYNAGLSILQVLKSYVGSDCQNDAKSPEITMVHQESITVSTSGHRDMHDLTAQITEVVARSHIATGTVQVFNVGSTGAIGTIEFEPGLQRDLPEILDRLMPPNPDYGHELAWHDGNGHSHLQATTLGPSISVPVANGKPVLGTWQQIFHLECDIKPRQREIVVTVVGE